MPNHLALGLVTFLIAVFTPISLAAEATASAPKQMALTFDDLPYATPVPDGWSLPNAQRVTAAILDALTTHGAPATAFVNEAQLYKLDQIDARTALLQRWVEAGGVLGNHTFSHTDLNKVSIDEYEDEIVRGDIVSRTLMASRSPYQLYFRHPYTHTGDTSTKKKAIERFLTARDYLVAPHTIDSQDYIFNHVYVVARQRGDTDVAERVCTAYVEFVSRVTTFSEQAAKKVFGRSIPQTILLHANDVNADCLDELLQRLAERQYTFVSLDTAMADTAYQASDTLVTAFGPTWLWRWTKSQGLKVSFKDDPVPPAWINELYEQVSKAHTKIGNDGDHDGDQLKRSGGAD